MDSAANTIVSVGQLVGEEFWLLRKVGGDVAELRNELATMSSLLRTYSEAEAGTVDHFVREWMKQLRELAYDAEDCVDLYIFRIKSRKGDGLLAWSKRMVATIFPRHLIAGKIKDLRLRAIYISERHARYGAIDREKLSPSVSLAPVAAVTRQALRPANYTDKLVGIAGQANTLAEKVKAMNNDQEDKLKVFSVDGFGGLGKTTLAMEVCRRLEPDFDRQALVSVSQAFDAGKDLSALLKRVLQQMVKPKADNEKVIKEEDSLGGDHDVLSVDQLARKLDELLADKRYLIVIDDVWTIAAWDAIRSTLPDGKPGSRIIVTTRIKTVAKECSDVSATEHYIHHMKPLTDEDSNELFRSRAFGSSMDKASHTKEMENISHNEELEDIMKRILKKCAGLPLAIVSIASLLASYKYPERKDMWETVWKSIGSQMESNPTLEGMRQILTLSYNHLPYHLKGCMMYLSIFPEDFEIPRDRLLYKWIAEGLVEEKRGLTLLEIAEGYFDDLSSRSMIDSVLSLGYNGKWTSCRVHDMLLEVMVSKSLEANFISLSGGQYEGMSYDRIRRLSVHAGANNDSTSMNGGASGRRGKRNSMERLEVQQVRSLSIFDFQEKKLLDRLGQFTLLRVLDLEDCKGLENKHVKDICGMYLLRFLSMKGTDISLLPEKVGELEHLQVLDVAGTLLLKLPETMTGLEKLEYLRFRHRAQWYTMWTPPVGIRKMKALQNIDCVVIKDVRVAQDLGELGDLRDVTIFVEESSGSTQAILDALVKSISKLYSLRSLGIGRFNKRSINFLNAMPSPPKLLQYLYLDGAMDEFPHWVPSLHNLVDVNIIGSWLRMDQVYGVLCKLPILQRINMLDNAYVDKELVARTTHNFPALRDLSANCRHTEVVKFEHGSMDMLEELYLHLDDYGRRIVGIQHLRKLKRVTIACNKHKKSAVDDVLDNLKWDNKRRLESNQLQFTVGVQYN
ncbi:hypothetical protein CFC21_105811 [Triticum aestivum]|uniref:Uncharacterized protein n=1 Tax=Triticum aestivum TaxID=4565 RepID=A0A9R1MCW3_WHEAT|nr:hypothetical protein CFC21_105811 [Triticum aestivum]